MKARKIVGGILAAVGLFAAVCTADGSAMEMALRIGGVALFALGASLTGWLGKAKGGEA